MSMTLEMFAVRAEQVDDVAVMDFDEFQEFVAEAESLDLGKAWGGVGWLLKAAGLNDNEVLFGEMMEEASISDFPPFFKSVEEVARIAALLESISEQTLREAFDPAAMVADSVYPEIWEESADDEEGEDDPLEWIIETVGKLHSFLRDCAGKNLCTISLMG
jgi:hypothetical protein